MTIGEQSIFSDLLIIELASVLAGPSVGMFFAELGAKVIKVENPIKGGDVTRHWRSKGEDTSLPQSAYYSSVNWGKEVRMLDLKDKTQYSELCALIKNADIVISNYLPRVAQALRVDYDTIKSINEQVIFANISGYGPDTENYFYYNSILNRYTGELTTIIKPSKIVQKKKPTEAGFELNLIYQCELAKKKF